MVYTTAFSWIKLPLTVGNNVLSVFTVISKFHRFIISNLKIQITYNYRTVNVYRLSSLQDVCNCIASSCMSLSLKLLSFNYVYVNKQTRGGFCGFLYTSTSLYKTKITSYLQSKPVIDIFRLRVLAH